MAKQQQQRVIEFSAVAQGRLNEAMRDLREGNAKEALVAFEAVGKEFPYVPSLNYLSAVAAMQAGEMDVAEALVARSIQARERESDAFALQAIMETQRAVSRSKVNFGDPTLRSEQLLWRAVLADPANPLPFIELATLLRYKGRHDEALKSLEAAQVRLQPVDSHVVVDVTLALVRLEGTPTDQLKEGDAQSDNVRTLMPTAYVALRKNHFNEAAEMLKRCRGLMAADLYDYLVNDPAFRKFAYRSELQTAFKN
jgi:tetratricopeptide (TPR) repeat protein